MKQTDYNYIYNQLIPAITRHDKRFIVEDMSGSLSFYPLEKVKVKGKKCDVLYATPFWEDVDGVLMSYSDSDGDYGDGEVLPYTLSGDLITDVVQYVKTVDEWVKRHS